MDDRERKREEIKYEDKMIGQSHKPFVGEGYITDEEERSAYGEKDNDIKIDDMDDDTKKYDYDYEMTQRVFE